MDEELLKAIELEIEQQTGVRPYAASFPRDYVYCQWCNSRGCVACFSKREQRKKDLDAEYLRQFPDGPKPIFTAKLDNPEQMDQLVKVFHREKIEKAFGPGGGGIEEIKANAATEMAARSKESGEM